MMVGGIEDGRQWYAARSQPGRIWMARDELARLGWPVWLPWFEAEVRTARRKAICRRALFANYLFVAGDEETIHAVPRVRYVARLVAPDGRARPVPPGVMDALVALADGDGRVALEGPLPIGPAPLAPGDEVRLLAGPFAGALARVDAAGRDEVAVWLDLLGGVVRARVDPHHVERAG